MTAALMLSSCVDRLQISLHLVVSDVAFSSDDKLLYADRPAAEKLRGPRSRVLVLDVVKSPTSAHCRCRRVAILVTGVSSDVRYAGASWCRHL